MRRIALAIALVIASIAAAMAQSTVTVIGPITPGDCPQFSSTTVIKDGGFPCNGSVAGPAGGDLSGSYPNPTVAPNAVTNAKLAQMPANTVKCNPTGSTANAQDCASPNPIVPDQFCTVDRTGSTDMGACINSAIAAAKSCNNTSASPGYGRVYLRAGTYLITTPIVPKSCTMVNGDGAGKTVLLTNSNAPFGPPAGQQLVHFNLDNLTFKDSGTHASAVAMTFPNCRIPA